MVYVRADGSVAEKRTLFRLSLISDIFWGVLDFVHVFFATLIDPKKQIASRAKREEVTGRRLRNDMNSRSNGGSGEMRNRGPNIVQLKDTACTAPGG